MSSKKGNIILSLFWVLAIVVLAGALWFSYAYVRDKKSPQEVIDDLLGASVMPHLCRVMAMSARSMV